MPASTPPPAEQRVLVVEDDDSIREMLASALSFAGFAISVAATAADGLQLAVTKPFDLFVLDVGLPDFDGFDLARQLRRREIATPVIFLTARREIDDLRTGFDTGAYDYLTKPFSLEELRIRIEAVLRRTQMPVPALDPSVLQFADIAIDDRAHRATRGGTEIQLTPTEYRLLSYLVTNASQVVSKDQILEAVWGLDGESDGRVVETYISSLRQKVDTGGARLIHTVRGFGYVLRESST